MRNTPNRTKSGARVTWRKVGENRLTEVVSIGRHSSQGKDAEQAPEVGPPASSPGDELPDFAPYRSTVHDALGRPIFADGELRVWLDDDLEDRRAPEGWIHLISAREVCFVLLTGRVVELSLDHDLSDDTKFGKGSDVIDFIEEQQEVHDRSLWPRDGINLHTANSNGRDRMAAIIRNRAAKYLVVNESAPGGQPRFEFSEDGRRK